MTTFNSDLLRRYRVREPVVLANGTRLSIQANEGAYCSPRNADAAAYAAVEVGFPSAIVEELLPYIEFPEAEPTEAVYPYVPAAVIIEVIANRGGMVGGELPPLVE